MASLKQMSKRRLLEEMVQSTAGPGNYIAMVVDDKTLRVLSSCCSVYDVLYDGVTVIELLSKQRQPLPELNALYFLSPSEDSIRALIDDFKDERKPQYRSAYVYLSSNIPESSKIMTRLADSPTLLPRIRCLVEFNLSFIAYEQRIFHFGMSNALLRLFPLPPPYLLQKIADDASDPVGGTLLILDRSVDVAPLFVHEYTYQALAYDILDLPVCCSTDGKKSSDGSTLIEDVYEYEVTSNMGVTETKKAILGEQDEVWVRYRHQHIQEVNESVQEEVQLFIKENSTAKVQQNIATTSEDTLQAIRSLPQYQEALARVRVYLASHPSPAISHKLHSSCWGVLAELNGSKHPVSELWLQYWTHVTLSEKCFDRLQELQIMTIGALEQDICCGVDKDGKEVMEAAQLSLVNQRCIQQFLERGLQQRQRRSKGVATPHEMDKD
ncbi:hypothetical protein ACSSS7_004013 [Eimeria intestinalis]